MRTYLLLAAGLALASCAGQKALPQYTEAEKQAQRESISYWQPDPADTAKHAPKWTVAVPPPSVDSIVIEPERTFLQKLLGRAATSQKLLKPTSISSFLPTKVKNSTLSVYYGTANVNNSTVGKKGSGAVGEGAAVTTTTTGKNSGPAVVGDNSTQHALTGGGNLAAQQGNGNSAGQTKQDTTEEAPGIGATLAAKLAGPPGIALAVVVVGLCVWGVVAWRKKKAVENLV